MDINDDEEDTPRTYVVTDGERRAHFTGPIRAEAATHDDRLERAEGHITSLLSSRKNTNRALWFVIPALIASLGTVLVFAAEMIATSAERVGETRATIEGLKDRINDLKDRAKDQAAEIAQLRATLLRLGVTDPRKPTSDVPTVPDGHALNQGDGAGGSSPQRPKLQRPQPSWGKIVHSGWLLQMSPHLLGRMTSSISLARSIESLSLTGALGGGSDGTVSTVDAHPATTTTTTSILSIPEM